MSARHIGTATAALSLGLLGACGTTTGGNGAANETPAPVAVQQQATTLGGPVELTATVGDLGQVLTDADGLALYRFDKDTAKTPASNGDGDCATAWLPLSVTGPVEAHGIDAHLVGTATRSDGSRQGTVAGRPVYRYAKDTAPGQANGHAVGGTRFEIETSGCKVTVGKKPANPSASTPPSTASGGD